MLNICVCDDDSVLAKCVVNWIMRYSFQIVMDLKVTVYTGLEPLMENFSEFDIIFLDINFHGEFAGVNAARTLRWKGCAALILFLSAFPDFSKEGYKAEAFRYITKPTSEAEICEVMSDCIAKVKCDPKRIVVVSQHTDRLMDTRKILYITMDSPHRVVVLDNERIQTWTSLSTLFTILPVGCFAYANKSHIVNMGRISTVGKGRIVMDDWYEIKLSRAYMRSFWEAYNGFYRKSS